MLHVNKSYGGLRSLLSHLFDLVFDLLSDLGEAILFDGNCFPEDKVHSSPVFIRNFAKHGLVGSSAFQELPVPESLSFITLARIEVFPGDRFLGDLVELLEDFALVDIGDVGVFLDDWDDKSSLFSVHT